MKWKPKAGGTVQRSNEGDRLDIPEFTVKCGEKGVCGTVKITGSVDSAGTDIEFEFTPSEEPAECCCEAYGWIQHVTDNDRWGFDNGTRGGGRGATSQPDKRPQGPPKDGKWDPNPWYGGPGNVRDRKDQEINDLPAEQREEARDELIQDWPRNPEPQTTIRDHPGAQVIGFVTQLVCVETGKVMFSYTWLQYKDRNTGFDYRFIGGEGDNLGITPE